MDSAVPARAGVLVVRVWVEDHPSSGFRARLIEARAGNPEQTVLTTASPHEASDAVRRWIDRFVEEEGGPIDEAVTPR